MTPIKTTLFALLTTVALSASLSSAQAWGERIVIINGELLNGDQLALLDEINCAVVPDGNYWLDGESGAWGYAGNPYPQGVVGADCGGGYASNNGSGGRSGEYYSNSQNGYGGVVGDCVYVSIPGMSMMSGC